MKKIVVFYVMVLSGWLIPAQENSTFISAKDLSPAVYLQQLQDMNADATRLSSLGSNRRITVVQQIGNNNSVTSQTTSQTANLGYFQIGDANTIESFSSIRSYSERIIQQGNDNEVLNYSFGPVDSASFNLIQSGNNLSFQKIGTNSQTDNMSFRLTGADRTVIIKSY